MKKIFLLVGIIVIILFSVLGVKKIILIRQAKKNQQIIATVQSNNNPSLQQPDNNSDSQIEFLPSLAGDQYKPTSANDIFKDAKNANNCKADINCLSEHVASCSVARGSVAYTTPTNKNIVLNYVILGKNSDKCEVEGIQNNAGDSPSTISKLRFDCQADSESLKQLFTGSSPSTYLMQNCSGTYTMFLKSKYK